MPIQEALADVFVDQDLKEKFDSIHRKESMEVLDDLGYISIDQNDSNYNLSNLELENAIKTFRDEYLSCGNVFGEKLNIDGILLTEEELNFLHKISSLEGEFDLHPFSLEQIGANPILSRILTWRLGILSVFNKNAENRLPQEINQYLDKLQEWGKFTSYHEIIEYTGDIDRFATRLVSQDKFNNSNFHHIVYFKSSPLRLKEAGLRFENSQEWFESRFAFIPEESIAKFKSTSKSEEDLKLFINDELNRLMTRLVQIKLWLFGTYDGILDNDMGPLTMNGLKNFEEYIKEHYRNVEGYDIKNLLLQLHGDYWALNTRYLFNAFLPVIESMVDIEPVTQSLSVGLQKVLSNFNDEDKDKIYGAINDIFSNDLTLKTSKKSKTHYGKSFLYAIGLFFNDLKDIIITGVDRVIKALKRFFDLFKHVSKQLLCELKKAYATYQKALAFFFSKRQLKTDGIISDFDANFDCVCTITSISKETLSSHIVQNELMTKAMNEISVFLGKIISTILKIIEGPYGWIKLVIEIAKELSNTALDNYYEAIIKIKIEE